MPTFSELTDALDQAWRKHDYAFAVSCIRDVLSRYRGSASQVGRALGLVSAPVYTNLAAAFEADDILKLMDRVARRISVAGDARRNEFNAEELAEERKQTRAAMQWLRRTVEEFGHVQLGELMSLAKINKVSKVKSRLNAMEKAGTIHQLGDLVHAGPSPQPQFEPMGTGIEGVPLFKTYFAHEHDMNDAQLAFFREFETRFRAGEHVELQGQWSYAFALISKFEDELENDSNAVAKVYQRFEQEYPDSPIADYSPEFDADSHFLKKDWQSGYDLFFPEIPLDIYLTLAPVIANSRLEPATIKAWATQSGKTTKAFRDREAEVDLVLQDLLDAAHDELGRSLFEDLWQRLIVERAPNERAPQIEDEFHGFITQEEIDDYLRYHDRALELPSFIPLELRDAVAAAAAESAAEAANDPDVVQWPTPFCYTYWFSQVVRARIKALYRDAENIARKASGIPSVGEGWVSEVLLLQLVREAFPERKVLHQGRPSWLGLQSLDIYLPDENIGVEYQGAQHSVPVTRFGGASAFEGQQERDARKRSLCLANGCQLVEVHPGYDLEDVLAEIREAIVRADMLNSSGADTDSSDVTENERENARATD